MDKIKDDIFLMIALLKIGVLPELRQKETRSGRISRFDA